jgi:hypothetical protein
MSTQRFSRVWLPGLLISLAVAAGPATAQAEDDAQAPRLSEDSSDAVAPLQVPGEWTLGEKEHWKLLQKELDQFVALMNDSCKTKIPVTFAHETFRGKLLKPGYTGLNGTPFASNMTQSIKEVREVCLKSDDGKQAVSSKITKIVLTHAGEGRAHKLDAKTLTVVLEPTANPREWQTKLGEFLKKSL